MTGAVRRFLLALQFLTRIPVTGRLGAWVGFDPAELDRCAGHFPGVGWVVGACGAAALLAAAAALPAGPWGAFAAATLSTACTAWATGAFHEDGLSDTADGLGGSVERERALAIMKDSRIGSYGTVTLVLALLIKCALLALLVQAGPLRAAAALLAAHVASRLAPLLLMRALPYVTPADRAKSKPLAEHVSMASLAAGTLWTAPALLLLLAVAGWCGLLAAAALWALLLAACWRLLRRRLGGFTGDTLGATQQVTEIALYLGLAAG